MLALLLEVRAGDRLGHHRGLGLTFDLDSGLKDLRAMLAEGRARGLELPLVERSIACYEEAARQGLGASEVSVVSAYWAGRKAP